MAPYQGVGKEGQCSKKIAPPKFVVGSIQFHLIHLRPLKTKLEVFDLDLGISSVKNHQGIQWRYNSFFFLQFHRRPLVGQENFARCFK